MDVLAALAEQHAELDDLVRGLDEEAWGRPSACAGWSLADVVLHLAQTDELATASLAGRFDEHLAELVQLAAGVAAAGLQAGNVDDGAELFVRAERGATGASVAERWRTSATALRDAFAATDPHARVTWVAGQLSARTLAVTRLSECWIHTLDVGEGLGVTPAPTSRLEHVARLAWRTLPYAFARAGRTLAGPVAFELRAPDGGAWMFHPEDLPAITVRGDGAELCLVAARRLDPTRTSLRAEGPGGDEVLELVRTYA